MSIRVGGHTLGANVLLAPMSGVTDAPFRRLAHAFGAGLVITEMIASADLANENAHSLRRAAFAGDDALGVVQLAGREAKWMAHGARMAEALGADIVDINMGCPAKQVTGSLSGSALMRDLDHALSLIEATVDAVNLPVTLKMRLGWDDDTKNAPELAMRAEAAGVQMISVHGRTRCQFYSGSSDWSFVKRVSDAVTVPVIVNGDIVSIESLKAAIKASGATGAMVGRGAYGRPWLPGLLARQLKGEAVSLPSLTERGAIVRQHYSEMLDHYGLEHGVRCARKHLGWYVEATVECGIRLTPEETKSWRRRFCQEDDYRAVERTIDAFYENVEWCEAA